MERIYKAQGYYEARARAARVTRDAKGRVHVEIVVEEGEPVRVSAVAAKWSAEQPPEKIEALASTILRSEVPGKPLEEAGFEDTKKRLQRALTSAGYAHAIVQASADVDLSAHRARLTYAVALGPPCTFGPITIEGAGVLPVDKLYQAIHIKEGQPYSTDRIEQAQTTISDLRVVGSVDGAPKITPGATVIPVVFTVTPASLKAFKTGLGAEVGSRVEAHVLAGWDNRNFLGGLRHFSVEVRPGVIINPLTISTLTSNQQPLAALAEARILTELEQPGFIEARTHGLLNASANLFQLQPTETLGYFELSSKSGVKRDFWGTRIHLGLFLNVTYDKPIALNDFSTKAYGNCGYNELIIPAGQSTAVLDLRYGENGKLDPLNPHAGIYLGNDVQLAFDDAPGTSSTIDVRIKPDLRGYIPITKHVTLALRFTGGLLYTFGGTLGNDPNPDDHGPVPFPSPVLPSPQVAETCSTATGTMDTGHGRYIQLLQLRGFTSGGPSSNRGYGYGGVGPQEVVTGVSPYVLLPTSGPNGPVTLLPIPTGGKALWEASVELRFPLYDKLTGTLFVDGSDVRRELADLGGALCPPPVDGLRAPLQHPRRPGPRRLRRPHPRVAAPRSQLPGVRSRGGLQRHPQLLVQHPDGEPLPGPTVRAGHLRAHPAAGDLRWRLARRSSSLALFLFHVPRGEGADADGDRAAGAEGRLFEAPLVAAGPHVETATGGLSLDGLAADVAVDGGRAPGRLVGLQRGVGDCVDGHRVSCARHLG